MNNHQSKSNQTIMILNCLIALTTLAAVQLAASEPLPGAENVCNITQPVKKDIIVEQPVKYEIKYQGMCGLLPCQKKKIETRVDQTIKTLIHYVERPTCCQGYTETPDRKCAPICLKSCSNGGKCVAPNVCKCSPAPAEWTPGFVGPTCARFTCLGENRWGSKCDKECNCPLNAYCSAQTGKCICYPGYRGANCTMECERDSTDLECEESNELPLIVEPDANLILDNANTISRQRSEALILERTPDETLQLDDRSSFGANYLASVLACLLVISLVGFLIYKRRYNKLKNEMLYSTGSVVAPSTGSDSTYSSGDGSSTYYATSQRSIALQNNNNNNNTTDDLLRKNLSFAAATRQLLLGDENKVHDNTQSQHDINNSKLVVNPLIESRLARSHQQAEQNLYSEIKVNFSERPLPNPDNRPEMRLVNITKSPSDEHHIYQVPRPRADNNNDLSIASSESSRGEDVIYEEIKPRTPST